MKDSVMDRTTKQQENTLVKKSNRNEYSKKMLLISCPSQVCSAWSGWYETHVGFVQQASHWAAVLCPRLIVIQREGHDR